MSAKGQKRKWPRHVRFGSKADIRAAKSHVCFTPQKRTFAAHSLKPTLRLEWQDQNGNEVEQHQHCALTLGDSLS